jgi:predicted lipoprotein
VSHVVVPAARDLSTAQRALTQNVAELERTASEVVLNGARSSWKAAALGWVRVESLNVLTTGDGRIVLRAAFWPPRTASLEEMLRGEGAEIETLGVDVRGMYALEWLLFGEPAPRLLAATPEGARARALAHALARDVEHQALELERVTGLGDSLSSALTSNPQASLSRLVNLTTDALERLVTDRLRPALARRTRAPLTAREIRGGLSGVSSELVAAQLDVIDRVYLGGEGSPGVAVLLHAVAPPIEQHLRESFRTAVECVGALDRSLEQLAEHDQPRVAAAHDALKALERALKTEVASALGITLTFESSDAD